MSSAAFSVPSGSPQRISLQRSGAKPTTATSSAADEAIRQVIDRRRRRNAGMLEPEPRASALEGAIGSVSEVISGSMQQLGMPQWVFRAVVLGAVFLVLGKAVYALSSGPTCVAHPATGVARIGKVPLVGAQIRLHPRGMTIPDDAVPTSTVQADGTFSLTTFTKGDGAPAGDYVVTVQWFRVAKDGSVGGNALPPRYASPTTSPLSVTIHEGSNQLPPFTFTR